MNHPLPLSQMTLLAGGAVVLGGLLVFMVYLIHKTFQDRRQAREFTPPSPRSQDEASFAMAALEGVIAKMKEQEKELVELRQAAERRARESARLSENVLREMPNGLMVFNRQGFLTTANPAVRKLLGVDTWARRRYPEILGSGSPLARRLEECLETGRTVAQETLEFQTAAGPPRVLGLSLSPLHAPHGEVEGVICLLTDLTEVQQLHEKVRLKEHLAALGSMSAGIAHELKNSLAIISGYAQLLRDADLSQENSGFAQKIVGEIRALTQVVTDFLNLSKPFSLAPRPVSLEDLLRQSVEDLRRIAAFEKLEFSIQGKFVPVEGDEILLRQAISNLLRNACEAVADEPESGSVGILGEIVCKSERQYMRILISDTGTGVPAENREKVFLPFFTTKPEGSGLGLALAGKIVAGHNGTLSLETASPQGACFVLQLPLRQETSEAGFGG